MISASQLGHPKLCEEVIKVAQAAARGDVGNTLQKIGQVDPKSYIVSAILPLLLSL